MLPGLDFTEVIVVIVVALLVLGPKDLPLMMRKLGRFMAKMRGMAAEFRSGFDELARQAELDELRREVDALRHGARDGLSSVTREFSRPVEEAKEAVMTPLPAPSPSAPAPTSEAAPQPIVDPEPPLIETTPPAQAAGGGR